MEKSSSMKTLTRILHGFIIVATLVGAVVFLFLTPWVGQELAEENPEFAWAYFPCLIWAWFFALPLFIAVWPCWELAGSLSTSEGPFTRKNVRFLHLVACLAFADALIYLTGLLILGFMGASQPGLTYIISPIVIFLCLAFGVVMIALSRVLNESVALREENDMTI